MGHHPKSIAFSSLLNGCLLEVTLNHYIHPYTAFVLLILDLFFQLDKFILNFISFHVQFYVTCRLSWPKCSLGFKVKIKRYIFSFSPRILLNSLFTVLFQYLLPSFRQLHYSVFTKLCIFLSKELFQMLFTVFQRTEFFFIRRIL